MFAPKTASFRGVAVLYRKAGGAATPENAPVDLRFIAPDEAGGSIGHLGYFRSRFARTLWPDMIGWLLDGRTATIGRPA